SRSPDSVLFQESLRSSSCQGIGGLFQPISRTLLRPTTVDFDVLPSAVAARFPMSPCRRTTRPGSVPTHPCREAPTIARPPATAPPTCGPTEPVPSPRRRDTAQRSAGDVPSWPVPCLSSPSRKHGVVVRTRSRVTVREASPAMVRSRTPPRHAVHPRERDVPVLRAHDHHRTPWYTPHRGRAVPVRARGRGSRCPPPACGRPRGRPATVRVATRPPRLFPAVRDAVASLPPWEWCPQRHATTPRTATVPGRR